MKLSVYLLSGIAALALPGVGMAQNAQPAQTAASSGASAAGQDQTPDIVVTGRPAGSGIRKLEAGYSVTTLSAQQIDVQNPKSTGDVLKSVPGVWVESSGGVGTSNIFVRGIPSTGDAPFVTVSINSSPVYGATGLSFLDQTALFRLDDTVANVENVQGGPAALFSDGEPGLTTNFLLREGHEHTEGDIKLTATDYGQRRIDGFISGKLADDLYYMMGGYVATGDSVRTANFDTEKGGQFTASITKKFSDGKLNVYARYTDDHGEWFLPFATAVPGINPGTYNAMNNYTRFQTIIVPGSAGSGATERVDLGSGRGWKGVVAGGNFNKDLGSGFSVADHFSYTNGTLQTTGLVPAGAGAITVATALASGNGTPGQTTVQTVDTGRTLASTDYVQQLGGWVVEKDLRSITNDLALNYDFSGHKLTAGYYFSHFSSDDAWSLGNTRWVSIGGEGDLVNLNNGTLGAFAISEFGTADENAIYLADSYNITEQLRLDAAIRYQDEKLHLIVLGNGTPNSLDDDRHSVPWTLGLNYRATHSFDIYIRASRGYHIPGFDDLRSQIGQLGTPAATSAPLDQNWSIQSYEGGLKYH
ncbi:MAG: TonB-dependent receptor, partial [Alphaproteobacteria bacterium]|nr:TonB-dependent receptor [Alphaproteobacteria bacterium]